jgi:hypothetical protein
MRDFALMACAIEIVDRIILLEGGDLKCGPHMGDVRTRPGIVLLHRERRGGRIDVERVSQMVRIAVTHIDKRSLRKRAGLRNDLRDGMG